MGEAFFDQAPPRRARFRDVIGLDHSANLTDIGRMAKVAREIRAATVLLPAKTGQFLDRAEDGTRIPKSARRRRPGTHSASPPRRHQLRCIRTFQACHRRSAAPPLLGVIPGEA